MLAKIRPILAPLLIFAAALLLAILLWSGALPDMLITLRTDLGNLLLVLSVLVAVPWLMVVLAWRRRRQAAMHVVRLEAADEKRRFLRRLDHELKNPLTAIRAGLANLAETHLEDAQLQTLSSVEAQTLRLSRLSSDLRKLAELETRPLERSTVDVNEMLHEAYSLAQDQPNAGERELKITVPQAPGRCRPSRATATCFSWRFTTYWIMPLNLPSPAVRSKSAALKTARRWWSRWPTPVRASRRMSWRMSARNCTAPAGRAASPATAWGWPWCIPS